MSLAHPNLGDSAIVSRSGVIQYNVRRERVFCECASRERGLALVWAGTRCVCSRLRKATVYVFFILFYFPSISSFALSFPFISSQTHFLYFYRLLFNISGVPPLLCYLAPSTLFPLHSTEVTRKRKSRIPGILTRSLPRVLPTRGKNLLSYPRSENGPHPHPHSNSLSVPSVLRHQSRPTNPSLNFPLAPFLQSTTLLYLLSTTTPYLYLTPEVPSLMSRRRNLLTQPSSPAQFPLALIRTPLGEARARPGTEA